ncbi:IDEAL domain-containing protein [Metabacillus arenae]|uniref:IDEAL domain-containing protein n=1 Tax=Metabacillus arenae TaxID=2771434 RepID=A0A926RWD7_9BACI|nr:IDEAL domain-containing protein [Metabacillus arenae]MBD1380673.1 IDEAL domain-containing protein [Metabacillus arenae]
MKNKKTYTEIMKSRNTQKKAVNEFSVLDLYIQMILDEAMFKRQMETLEEQLEAALVTRDKDSFMDLSKKYNKLKLIL